MSSAEPLTTRERIEQCDLVTIVWTGQIDDKLATEVGYCFLLDKPYIVYNPNSLEIPKYLTQHSKATVTTKESLVVVAERIAAHFKNG